MADMKSFKAFLQREAREQLAKIILVGAASIGVEELELAGAELKRTVRVLVACGSCRFRLRPATAGITSLRHHSNTASFSRRRPTRTLLVNNSFPRVKKRTRRSVVFSTRMPLNARLVRTTLSSGLQSTHSSTVTKLLSSTASSTVSTKCSKDDFFLLPWLHTLCVVDRRRPPKNLWSLH